MLLRLRPWRAVPDTPLPMLGFSTAASFAFAALADDRIPNQEAIALSPTIGWLLLGCALFVYLMFALQNERWRRFWLTMEDPRPVALFRIVFAFLCICNINDLWEYFDVPVHGRGHVPQRRRPSAVAAGQFKGFGEGQTGEPLGFFDAAGCARVPQGPEVLAAVLLRHAPGHVDRRCSRSTRSPRRSWSAGSRASLGILSFMLMNSFFLRNHLFWEGTELVYRVFFVYLLARPQRRARTASTTGCACASCESRACSASAGGPGGGAGLPPSAPSIRAGWRRSTA